MAENNIRVVLVVAHTNGSLTGHASADDGPTHAFVGWLGLLNVLETLLPNHTQVQGDRRHDDADPRI